MDGSMPQELNYEKVIYKTETISLRVTGNNLTPDVFKLALRWKRLCMENMYMWKTMDKDIIKEALKVDGR